MKKLFKTQDQYDNFNRSISEVFGVEYVPILLCDNVSNYTPISHNNTSLNGGEYIILNSDGNSFHITNLTKFCKENGLNRGKMCSVSFGRLNHYRGWQCRKLEDNRPFYTQDELKDLCGDKNSKCKEYTFKSPDGTIYRIKNLSKFCRQNNLNRDIMYRVFSGSKPQHKGWTAPTL